jgi:transposase InsO family protein
LLPLIERVWRASGERYGADKVWMQLNRDGVAAARCTVERLMRREGWRSARAGRTQRRAPLGALLFILYALN